MIYLPSLLASSTSSVGKEYQKEKSSINRSTSTCDPVYTKIRGKWYDFGQFNHPGGPIALSLVKDRDGTAMFESHHLLVPRLKLENILKKYQVCESKASKLKLMNETDGGHFDWKKFENDKFVLDAKEILVDYLSPIAERNKCTLFQAAKATPRRWTIILALASAFIAMLPHFIAGKLWSVFVIPQLAWVFWVNYWHDSLHFSLSRDWRVNAVLPYFFAVLSSPHMWYHQHNIGHHAYTNIAHKDPDLAHAPQLMREHPSIKWRESHTNQDSYLRVTFVWSIATGLGLSLLNDFKTNMKLSYNNVVPFARLSPARMVMYLLGRAIYVYSIFLWPFYYFPLWKAVIFATVPIAFFSLSFMLNTQINHLTENCHNASDKNFLKHQVVTAQNFGCNSSFCFLYSGGLNFQIEHHLYPYVNHCHLPSLAPKVKALCKKHDVPYNEAAGYGDALKSHFAHTKKMSQQPF